MEAISIATRSSMSSDKEKKKRKKKENTKFIRRRAKKKNNVMTPPGMEDIGLNHSSIIQPSFFGYVGQDVNLDFGIMTVEQLQRLKVLKLEFNQLCDVFRIKVGGQFASKLAFQVANSNLSYVLEKKVQYAKGTNRGRSETKFVRAACYFPTNWSYRVQAKFIENKWIIDEVPQNHNCPCDYENIIKVSEEEQTPYDNISNENSNGDQDISDKEDESDKDDPYVYVNDDSDSIVGSGDSHVSNDNKEEEEDVNVSQTNASENIYQSFNHYGQISETV